MADTKDKRRYWCCPRGHILGEVRRVAIGAESGIKVGTLMLYETSATYKPQSLPVLRGKVVGEMRDIKCTVPGCGAIRDWMIGEDAMSALMERIRSREPVS
jgi:hypothetical protein